MPNIGGASAAATPAAISSALSQCAWLPTGAAPKPLRVCAGGNFCRSCFCFDLELPVAADGVYSLEFALTKARDYGIVQVQIDDESLCLYEMKLTFPENMERGTGLKQLEASTETLAASGAGLPVHLRPAIARRISHAGGGAL